MSQRFGFPSIVILSCLLSWNLLLAQDPESLPSTQLSLEECIQWALRMNPQIDAANYQVQQAESKEGEAKAGELPRIEVLDIFGAVPEARGDVLNSPDKTTDIGGLGPFNRVEVNITQPIYTFGMLSSYIEAAQHGLVAQKAKKEMTHQEVIYEVKKLYYATLLNRKLLEVLTEVKDNFQKAVEKSEELIAEGSNKITQTEFLKLKLGANEIEQQWARLYYSEPLTLAALKQAVGIKPNADFDMEATDLTLETANLQSLEEHIAQTFEHRPEWKALQAGIEAKKEALEAEKKTPYPAFFVNGLFRYGVAPNRDDQKNPFVSDDFNFVEAGAFLGVRVAFDFGYDDRVAGARAELDQLKADQSRAELGFPVEVQQAWLAVKEMERQFELAQEARRNARTLLGLAVTHHELGVGKAKDIYEAIEFFTKALSNYYLTIHDYNMALAQLSKVTGREVTNLSY
ncbi:MAG: TolC family protein [Deltaproteobacteria bacterium]|nr:TolC family protein [Deltaproteobacteria bacterium]